MFCRFAFDGCLLQENKFVYYECAEDGGGFVPVSLDLATGAKTGLNFSLLPPGALEKGMVLGGGCCLAFTHEDSLVLVNLDSGGLLAKVEGCGELVSYTRFGEESRDRICYCWNNEQRKLFELSSGRLIFDLKSLQKHT